MDKLEKTIRKALEKELGKQAKPWLDEKVIISMPNRKESKNEDS